MSSPLIFASSSPLHGHFIVLSLSHYHRNNNAISHVSVMLLTPFYFRRMGEGLRPDPSSYKKYNLPMVYRPPPPLNCSCFLSCWAVSLFTGRSLSLMTVCVSTTCISGVKGGRYGQTFSATQKQTRVNVLAVDAFVLDLCVVSCFLASSLYCTKSTEVTHDRVRKPCFDHVDPRNSSWLFD